MVCVALLLSSLLLSVHLMHVSFPPSFSAFVLSRCLNSLQLGTPALADFFLRGMRSMIE